MQHKIQKIKSENKIVRVICGQTDLWVTLGWGSLKMSERAKNGIANFWEKRARTK